MIKNIFFDVDDTIYAEIHKIKGMDDKGIQTALENKYVQNNQ